MAKMALYFYSRQSVVLEKISFTHPLLQKPRVSVRGKTSGAYIDAFSFQWTSALRGLVVLLLYEKAANGAGSDSICLREPLLKGGQKSLAASLDFALAKQPVWILDTFGIDEKGRSLLRRLLLRTNPERKRGGEVFISLNRHQLCPADVEVYVNDGLVESSEELRLLSMKIAQEGYASRPKCPVPRSRLISDENAALNPLSADYSRP